MHKSHTDQCLAYILVRALIYIHASSIKAAKVQVSLCTDSSELSLLPDATGTEISCTCQYKK